MKIKPRFQKPFNKGDFVKLFGKVRKNIDENGKEHINVRILDSRLLKARDKERVKRESKSRFWGKLRAIKI